MPKHNRFQVRKDLDALSFIRRSWEALDTPVSLSCYLLMKYEEYDQLATKSIEPSDYLTPGRYLLDAQSLALITKYPFLGTSFSTKTVALKKFLDCEVQCQETNRRFDQLEEIKDFPELYSILYRAKDKIDRILGQFPNCRNSTFDSDPVRRSACGGKPPYTIRH